MRKRTATKVTNPGRASRRKSGFTLAEVVISLGILGVVTAGVYGAIMSSFGLIQSTRENLRAAQILQQTMEVLRLCNWSQTSPATNFIPTSLTVPFYTDNVSVTNLPLYALSVTVTNTPAMSAWYTNAMRMVTVQATWTSAGLQHSRSVSTFVSEWGIQNYVW